MNDITKKLLLPLVNGNEQKIKSFISDFFTHINLDDYTTKEFTTAYKEKCLTEAFEQGINQDHIDFVQLLQILQKEQKEELTKFLQYLSNNDNYDLSFSYLFIKKVLKSTENNKKRTTTSVAFFPKFDASAIARAYDQYTKNNFSFFDYYFIVEETKETKNKKGWIKYPKNSDASLLAADAHKCWCTSGVSMASSQLAQGDFYIYHDNGPKIAIRMTGSTIAEVRGSNENQELDPLYMSTAETKANDLDPQYFTKFKHQKFLINLLKKQNCTPVEIAWVYLFEPAGFGYGDNPALIEFKQKYDAPNIDIELNEIIDLL